MIKLIDNPVSILLFSCIANTLGNMLYLKIAFTFMDIKIPIKKSFLCSFLGMILYVIPIFLVSGLVRDPLIARVWIYRLFIVVNPLSGCFLYFLVKWIFKFSPTRSSIIMHNHLLVEYVSSLGYIALSETFAGLWNIKIAANGFFILDYPFSILRLAFTLMFLRILTRYLKKSRKYIIVPPNYADKNVKKNLLKTFLAIGIIYTIIVLFRINSFPLVLTPINIHTAYIYILLIATIILYLRYTIAQCRKRLLDSQMQATGTYISSLLHTNQEFRAIKHDFYNVLQGYGGYLEIKDYKGLEAYHHKLFAATKQAGDFLSIIEVLRSRIAVYSLLEKMSEKAKQAKVSFSINLICDVTDIVLDDVELCRVLGIVIDNAIEEAELSEHKQVNISFERKDENTIVLIVSNTTKTDVDTKQIFNEGYTTKSNHTGIGLSNVLHILNYHEHCSLRVNYHDNQFTMFLILNADKKARI